PKPPPTTNGVAREAAPTNDRAPNPTSDAPNAVSTSSATSANAATSASLPRAAPEAANACPSRAGDPSPGRCTATSAPSGTNQPSAAKASTPAAVAPPPEPRNQRPVSTSHRPPGSHNTAS